MPAQSWKHLPTAAALAAALLAAPGCGDDATSTPDAGADAAPGPDAGPAASCTCLALGVDYMNGVGVATSIRVPSLETQVDVAAGGVSGDPVLRLHGDKFYVVNRLVANLTIIDAATLAVDDQFSIGASGDNAQDVAVNGREAWIVYLGVPEVRVYDLDAPDAAPTVIALPKLAADVDANPDATSIAIAGGKAYVTLQHLESFMPVAAGGLVVIDLASREVTTTIELPAQNPVNFLRTLGDELLVGLIPDYTTPQTGCLARVATGATPAATCMAAGTALGGMVNGIAPADDGSVLVAVGPSFTEGKVVRVAADGTVEPQAYTAAGHVPTDVATCGKYLVANDNAAGGVRVYDTSARTELTTAAIDVGEPPAFASGLACFPE